MKNYLLILTAVFFVLTGCNKNDSKTGSSTGQNTEQNADKDLQSVEFKCEGMTCTGCEDAIKSKVKKLSSADIENTINKAGYHAEVYKPGTEQKK